VARLEDIHRAARRGDVDALKQCVVSGTSIDLPDTQQGHTPLMHACLSPSADVATVRWLIEHGADVNAFITPPPDPMEDLDDDLKEELKQSMAETMKEMGESMDLDPEMMEMLEGTTSHTPAPERLLSVVAQEASIKKLELLVQSGAEVDFQSSEGYTALIKAACSGREDAMKLFLENGSPTDVVSSYGESALSRVAGMSRFDLVKLLLDHGANPEPLEWTPLMMATVFGSQSELEHLLDEGADLEATDRAGRTALWLAISKPDLPRAEWLLERGAVMNKKTDKGTPSLHLVIQADQDGALQWLLDRGFDPNAVDSFSTTPLMVAAEYGAVRCFRRLTESGADWKATDHIDESVIQKASHPEIVGMLVRGGENPAKLETQTLRKFIGLGTAEDLEITPKEFKKGRKRRFGKANPEPVNIPFWNAMVRTGWNAYEANDLFDLSSFGNSEPTWCHDRFGMSLTCLPDGRFVQVAGEHEDGYDPDFCIYNDVVVHDGRGEFQIHAYPEKVFPPTDFHTATLVGSWIYLIGNLSYPEHRKTQAQVMRLNLQNWSIEPVATQGDDPGWIHGHQAQVVDGSIHISGGKRWIPEGQDDGEIVANATDYEFDPTDGSWSRSSPLSGDTL